MTASKKAKSWRGVDRLILKPVVNKTRHTAWAQKDDQADRDTDFGCQSLKRAVADVRGDRFLNRSGVVAAHKKDRGKKKQIHLVGRDLSPA